MSDNTERPDDEQTIPVSPEAGDATEPQVNPETLHSDHGNGAPLGDDPREALKQRLEETRLPTELRAQILAELPSPEEQERMYRELRERGGLSAKEFFASLGLEVLQQP